MRKITAKEDCPMDLIPSFSVDHTRIVPGIYESRVDTVGDALVTTFDIRLKKPNAEPAVAPAACETSPCGRTSSFTGGRWAASPAFT